MSAAPAAVTVVNEHGTSPIVLLCEHASNHIPAEFGQLGLASHELQRHIAWDIGVASLARQLSAALDAPLFLAGYSRLLIDCNRPLDVPSSIPELSELTPIPGNTKLTAAQCLERATKFYWPFQNAVSGHLDRRQNAGRQTLVIGVHSFTPVFKGFTRPWHAGILFEPPDIVGDDTLPLGERLLSALMTPDLNIAANQPYQISDASDYTVPVHGRARGLDACLIEVRQDLLAGQPGIVSWTRRLIPALAAISQPPRR